MIGNLIGSGLFSDKIMREDVLNRVIQLMDPTITQQVRVIAKYEII
jgi:hypothetical protein